MLKIALGADHAGCPAKEKIKEHLRNHYPQFEIEDYGTLGEEKVDYPDYAHLVAQAVSEGKVYRGVLTCGTGVGMSIVANRHPGTRAALCHDLYTARMARLHNDANILVVGGRVLSTETILQIVDTFLATEFEGGRHLGRLAKIELPEARKE
jgi:ribose 5-phosphate isomerase B